MKKLDNYDILKYMVIGLGIGISISCLIKINIINGICIGISLGVLLVKMIGEKKILLSIYIMMGLLIGGLTMYFTLNTIGATTYGMSFGMLISTIIYMMLRKYDKYKVKDTSSLLLNILVGIILGAIFGQIIFPTIGIAIGIAVGIILGVYLYIIKLNKQIKTKSKKKNVKK